MIKREGINSRRKIIHYVWQDGKYIPEFAFLWGSKDGSREDTKIGEIKIENVVLPLQYSCVRKRGITDLIKTRKELPASLLKQNRLSILGSFGTDKVFLG